MQWYLFRLTPARRSCLSPIPDGWQLWNKMVGLIPWVSKLWPVVTELLYILRCTVPCRCTKVVIWKIPVWCLTFLVFLGVFHIDVQTSRICDSPFYLHGDGWALQSQSWVLVHYRFQWPDFSCLRSTIWYKNEKEIVKDDPNVHFVRTGWYKDVMWMYYTAEGRVEHDQGLYVICDNCYLRWPTSICPYSKVENSTLEGYFSSN